MYLKIRNVFIVVFLISTMIKAQESYSVGLDFKNDSITRLLDFAGIGINFDGEVSVMIELLGDVEVYSFSKDLSNQTAFRFSRGFSFSGGFGYRKRGDFHLLSSVASNGVAGSVCIVNTKKNISWCRETGIKRGPIFGSVFLNDNKIISGFDHKTSSRYGTKLNISSYDVLDGKYNWGYEFKRTNELDKRWYFINSVTEQNDSSFLVAFKTSVDNSFDSGILKFSSTGEMLDQIIMEDDSVSFFQPVLTDSVGNIYVGGFSYNQSNWGNSNEKEAFIAKFDSNLELLWSKRLSAEYFSFLNLDFIVQPNGEIMFSYSTFGDLPVIVGTLDSLGNLKNYRGFPFHNPEMEIGHDKSVYFYSSKKYLFDGSSEFSPIIAKTNSNGNIEGCSHYNSCLTLHDFEFSCTKWDWEFEAYSELPYANFSIEPIEFSLINHCGTPRPPTPKFNLPDTVCQNTCLSPDSLYNFLAHATEWTITGDNVNFTSSDTSFNYCFLEPGEYQIEQEIWLLGCSEFYTRTLTVLPGDLGDLLGEDRLLCDSTPQQLSVSTTRPILNYQWQDGSNDSIITVSNTGSYAVTVSDGYCTKTDEVQLTYFEDWLLGEAFEIPIDSSVCVDLLPLSLKPESQFTDEFYLNFDENPQSEFLLNTAGVYTISAEINGCRAEKKFELKTPACEIDIFLPNSFSPNDDGINDFAQVFGNEFEGISLEIYDRWGGKLFETEASPFAWNGRSSGKKAAEGVYVLVFKYRNRRTGREELISGDVLLVR